MRLRLIMSIIFLGCMDGSIQIKNVKSSRIYSRSDPDCKSKSDVNVCHFLLSNDLKFYQEVIMFSHINATTDAPTCSLLCPVRTEEPHRPPHHKRHRGRNAGTDLSYFDSRHLEHARKEKKKKNDADANRKKINKNTQISVITLEHVEENLIQVRSKCVRVLNLSESPQND